MSNNKIEISVKDIPIVVEELEKANAEIEKLNSIINEIEKYSENMISEYNEEIEKAVDNIDKFNLLGARSSYREISNKIKELKGSVKE